MGSPCLKHFIGKKCHMICHVDHDVLRKIMRCSTSPPSSPINTLHGIHCRLPNGCSCWYYRTVVVGINSVEHVVNRGSNHDIARNLALSINPWYPRPVHSLLFIEIWDETRVCYLININLFISFNSFLMKKNFHKLFWAFDFSRN